MRSFLLIPVIAERKALRAFYKDVFCIMNIRSVACRRKISNSNAIRFVKLHSFFHEKIRNL